MATAMATAMAKARLSWNGLKLFVVSTESDLSFS